MKLNYSHIDILVPDLEEAVSYYRRVLGCSASKIQVWQRGDFHVRYVILFKDSHRFMLVCPISGNLKELLDKKGAGTIYRFCLTTPDLSSAYKELVDAGVQPENENGKALKLEDLASPSGVPAMWLPKVIGDLSIEILEEAPQEARLSARRAESA